MPDPDPAKPKRREPMGRWGVRFSVHRQKSRLFGVSSIFWGLRPKKYVPLDVGQKTKSCFFSSFDLYLILDIKKGRWCPVLQMKIDGNWASTVLDYKFIRFIRDCQVYTQISVKTERGCFFHV